MEHNYVAISSFRGLIQQCKSCSCVRSYQDAGQPVYYQLGVKSTGEPSCSGDLSDLIKPLVAISKAYFMNALDDEARHKWGKNEEHMNTKHPDSIELFSGRGGKELLTLGMCIRAQEAVDGCGKGVLINRAFKQPESGPSRLVYCTRCHKTHSVEPNEKPCADGVWLDPNPVR
jgi:hypothetical protein